MKRNQERELYLIFRNYKQTKKELDNNYSIPVPSGIDYDKISIKTDKSKNNVEDMTVDYCAKREDLFRRVFIVEETLKWFQLEGHGRERFIHFFFIDGNSWVKTESVFRLAPDTIRRWRRDVLEKAKMIESWTK